MRGWVIVLATSVLVLGCATKHQVDVATPEPITINLNIKLDLAEEVVALMREEQAVAAMRTRALGTPPLRQIEDLKQRGLVGETFEGYVAPVDPTGTEPPLEALLLDINQRRTAEYEELADEHGQPRAVVEAVAGETRIAQEPSGHLVMARPGEFVTKP